MAEYVEDDERVARVFPLYPASELAENIHPINWAIKGVIEIGSLNYLIGDPSSGKTLLALDWAYCLSAGIDWHGIRTNPCDVVLIAGEGNEGLKRRIKALNIKYKQARAPSSLFMSGEAGNFMDPHKTIWIADSIKAMGISPGLVIVDTMHRNMEGDENDSQDVGLFIKNLDILMNELGCAVLVVHHCGHGDKTRGRGSSAIRAACDGEFVVNKDVDGFVKFECIKSKDFEAFKPMQFTVKEVGVGVMDDENNEMTAVYLEETEYAHKVHKVHKLTNRESLILSALDDAVEQYGVALNSESKRKFPVYDGKKAVAIEHWKKFAFKAIAEFSDDSKKSAKSMAFKRCVEKLDNYGLIGIWDDFAWKY